VKRLFVFLLSITAALTLGSWGFKGHNTVGAIAERHLTPKAKAAVQDLLGKETLAEASTWADDVKSDPDYKHTRIWHYVNLPSGLDRATFESRIKEMSEGNVYKAVLKCKDDLRSATAGRKEKIDALKFLVHFVGDLHQPMHVGHAEDKGGNTVQVSYKMEGSNLHSVWDTKLIEDEGSTYAQLADKSDKASPAQIQQWQKDDLMQWLWESYQAAGKLYAEIDAMKKRSLKNDYYEAHIPVVYERLGMAGIRLAGMLNEIFDDTYTAPAALPPAKEQQAVSVKADDAKDHIGEYAEVCSRIYGSKEFEGITLVNIGADYPHSPMTIVLKGPAREAHKRIPRKKVCITGKIIDYKGKPEIIVTDPKMFVLQ
jgi:hypothetical protein